MPDVLTNNYMEQKIEAINKNIDEIKYIQRNIATAQKENNILLMKKVSKLQEYNKISDMTNQIFETRICNIEDSLNKIIKKLSA